MSYLHVSMIEAALGCALWLPFLAGWGIVKRWEFRKTVQMGIFLAYATVVFKLTGLPSFQYFTFSPDIYLGAFVGMLDDRLNSVLNVFLFLPMGFLLTRFCRDCRRLPKAVLAGFCLSLFIELSQMFCLRLTDVNDLITNTFGTFLGALIAKPFCRKIHPTISGKELTVSLAGAVLLLFLFWQYLLDFFWTMT